MCLPEETKIHIFIWIISYECWKKMLRHFQPKASGMEMLRKRGIYFSNRRWLQSSKLKFHDSLGYSIAFFNNSRTKSSRLYSIDWIVGKTKWHRPYFIRLYWNWIKLKQKLVWCHYVDALRLLFHKLTTWIGSHTNASLIIDGKKLVLVTNNGRILSSNYLSIFRRADNDERARISWYAVFVSLFALDNL